MTTLDSAAAVLRCFAIDRPELTVTEAARLLGAPKSTTSRLLRAMRDAGLLELAPPGKRYRPGLLLFEAGRLYQAGSSLLAEADAAVGRLAAEVGHTGYVSVLDGVSVVGLKHHVGQGPLRVATPTGRRLEAQATATGRALLARLDDLDVRARFADGFAPASPTAPGDLDDLIGRLDVVRRQGFAQSFDEANHGVAAQAVAVGTRDAGEAVALCIAYPLATVDESLRGRIVHGLLAARADLARRFDDPVGLPLPPHPRVSAA
ncbi:IclR family transcriptional regulator [Marinivivus vitaminiproducens]|uniref:IclR family transcriptional regulator n=1 Tax=Marinivivus vitaminiproducens TaxID=3035935 RepID=UPI00279BC823|nr:IclR family transcriptional regulator [Geminicoccaceae bacterium SCSIO 64248]